MKSDIKHISRCMFCNSTSYGTGCPYSPHRKHVHTGGLATCIYCGSTSVGSGCPYNPFTKIHLRGAQYNMMTAESIHKSLTAGLFLNRLVQPITDMPAYKLGLIDERGHIVRESVNEDEKRALAPFDKYILKIRRLIGEDTTELFKSSVLLEMSSPKQNIAFDASVYEQEVKIKSDVKHIVENMATVFDDAVERGFSRAHVENLLIEAILKLKDYEN